MKEKSEKLLQKMGDLVIITLQQKTRSISEPGLMCLIGTLGERQSNVLNSLSILRSSLLKSTPQGNLLPKHTNRLGPAAAATYCRRINIGINREKGNEKPTLTGLELGNSLKIPISKTLKYVFKITYRVQFVYFWLKNKRSPSRTRRKSGDAKLVCWSR